MHRSGRAFSRPWCVDHGSSSLRALDPITKAVCKWLPKVGVKTLFIEPDSPWGNGYIESFNGEIFYTLKEVKVLIEQWRNHYNTVRPHSALGYRPPAPMAILPTPRAANHPDHASLQKKTNRSNSLLTLGPLKSGWLLRFSSHEKRNSASESISVSRFTLPDRQYVPTLFR